MASHSGLKYVLETKKGYVCEDGSYTDDINKAHLIDFWQFGFGPDAIDVFHKLGYHDAEIDKVEFHSVVPPYEGRDLTGLTCYLMLGYDYKVAYHIAQEDYFHYSLNDDNNYFEYINLMQSRVNLFYQSQNCDEWLITSDEKIKLSKRLDQEDYVSQYGNVTYFYSGYKDYRKVYRISIPLKNPHVENYFDFNKEKNSYYNTYQQKGLKEYIIEQFNLHKFAWELEYDAKLLDVKIENDCLVMYTTDWSIINDNKTFKKVNEAIRDFYYKKEMHITRMFGSYILLIKEDDKLVAKEATNIPIKYCPLMVKLLKEVGGDTASKLLETLKTEDKILQQKMMCNLINEVVIKGGYFDTNRPLNSCEANVTFGASETMSSAFLMDLIDASVIVSNNLGTIITTNAPSTQGAVKRMTGLFYTTPNKQIMDIAKGEGIIPVFPYSAQIDQLAGVKKAIELGYKRIAVSVAADNNYLHEELAKLESEYDVKIYKFGLCSTGINEYTANIMKEYADVVWSCASKNVKEYIEPNAIAQVGLKIPVHIMTSDGWKIVENHLHLMDKNFNDDELELTSGENKPIIVNSKEGLKVLKKKEIKGCIDCPHPCI